MSRAGVRKLGALSLLVALSVSGCGDSEPLRDPSQSAGASFGGDTGKAGGSGKGGGSGEGVGSGEGGHAPAILGCDGELEFVPNAQVVRSCILRAGCEPTFTPLRTISTCVSYNTQAALRDESCNLSSTSCADFEVCEHTEELCTRSNSSRCEGNDAVTVCSDGTQLRYDCGSVGLACATTGRREYCFAPGCNAADIDFVCNEGCSDDGSSLTFCYGGLPYSVECSDYGFTKCASDTDKDGRAFAACRL